MTTTPPESGPDEALADSLETSAANEPWPTPPAWGFALVAVLVMVLAVCCVWLVNYFGLPNL